MKRFLVMFAVAVVFFVLGAGSVLFLKRTPPSLIPEGWVDIKEADTPILFDMTAIKSDIPMPKPGKIEGRVKFLQRDNGLRIGYMLKLPIKPNPVSALPEKYRQSTKYGEFTVNPPDQVDYSGTFTFDFQDGDGFSLGKVKGPKERVAAGSDNPVQGMTEDVVPANVAEHAKKIAVSFDAEKCNLCDERK